MEKAYPVSQTTKYSDGTETIINYNPIVMENTSEEIKKVDEIESVEETVAEEETVETPEVAEEAPAESVEETA